MRTRFSAIFIALLLLTISLPAQTHKQVTLEDLWINYAFYPERSDEIVPMNDGEHYLVLTNSNTIDKFFYKNYNLDSRFHGNDGL